MKGRALVVVLDACGVGALPDAADYGDAGADTLPHVAQAVGGLKVPNLGHLGLGNITAILGVPPSSAPAVHGRLHPLGPGKDSTTGHWELMGAVTPAPLPTYPDGFPPEVVERIKAVSGHTFCCNKPYSGTAVIDDYGEHHLQTGELILYTSADSVLQIAAHDDVLPEPGLHAVCAKIRTVMTGEHAVGRVIARPFTGVPGAFTRTTGRKDFSVDPPSRTYLDELHDDKVPVHSVGKVHDLFAGRSIDVAHAGKTNAQALQATTELLRTLERGLIFVNLVETDQLYGHRKDVEGFHAALREIDEAVGMWVRLLGPDDLLILTADHGVDPDTDHNDHTREHVPLLAVYEDGDSHRHDGPMADVGATVLRWLTGREVAELPGVPITGDGFSTADAFSEVPPV
ncbi:MAG TPA: phosphopentomutase [Baekduia sp.]|uniref:phosphopentomutase n=1 Tax=Baekduia sp. TaxID=2600305 RepID=UPI002B858782|nr:phosphopentomutase [Baekduia sp.]HMJ33786.1 phosphopentomutase [Baekduia sp.]